MNTSKHLIVVTLEDCKMWVESALNDPSDVNIYMAVGMLHTYVDLHPRTRFAHLLDGVSFALDPELIERAQHTLGVQWFESVELSFVAWVKGEPWVNHEWVLFFEQAGKDTYAASLELGLGRPIDYTRTPSWRS